MKKKVLFVVTSFRQGGISRSLQNLLSFIGIEKYDADVYALESYGPYRQMLPNCTILKSYLGLHAYIGKYEDMSWGIKPLSALLKLSRIVSEKLGKDFNSWFIRRYVRRIEKKNHYDTIVAFSEGVVTHFVSYSLCNNKVAWIHCDYASYYSLNNKKNELSFYSSFQHIVNVSNFTRGSFLRIYPTLEKRLICIYNILDSKMMKGLAKEKTDEIHNDLFTLVSIGRIDPVKNMSVIPSIAKSLHDKGALFRWYIIGPVGSLEELQKLENNIQDNNVGEQVFYLGSQDNPYRFIQNTDLLVNVSLSEACPYVINEAKILHKPVVCSNFGSASEFIVNGDTGYISDYDDMPEILFSIISNRNEYMRLKCNLSTFEYDNNTILNQIDNIL